MVIAYDRRWAEQDQIHSPATRPAACRRRPVLLDTARFLPSTANPTQTSGRNDVFGHGLVQVRDAVEQALKDSPPL